ncbi:hypothetical protein pb186bvf_004134 [Paramecium bursaria]
MLQQIICQLSNLNNLYVFIFLKLIHLQKLLMIKITSLRGGGVCQIKSKLQQNYQESNQNTQNWITDQSQKIFFKLKTALEQINKKSISLLSGLEDIQQSIQIVNQCEFWIFDQMQNKQQISFLIEFIQENIIPLLQSAKRLIKQDHQITQQILEIISSFMRVMFTFQLYNDKRYISNELCIQWMEVIKQIDNEINIEKVFDCYRNSIDYEIYVIKMSIIISNTDEKEGQKILKNLFLGLINTIASFPLISIDDKLFNGITQGIIYLVDQKHKQDYLSKFQIIYVIEQFKWKLQQKLYQLLLDKIKFDEILNEIVQMYEQLKITAHWSSLYCWIRMIGTIITNTCFIRKSEIDEKLKQLLITKKLAFPDQDQNLLLLLDKKYYDSECEQLLILHFPGLHNICYLYFFILRGTQLPTIDKYQLQINMSNKQECQSKFQQIMSKIWKNFKQDYNRVRKSKMYTRMKKFKNILVFHQKDKKVSLKEIIGFYESKLIYLDTVLEMIPKHFYFFDHTSIIYQQIILNIQDRNPNIQQINNYQEEIRIHLQKLEMFSYQLIETKLQILIITQFCKNNIKYKNAKIYDQQIESMIQRLENIASQIEISDDFIIFCSQYYNFLKIIKLKNYYYISEEYSNQLQILQITLPYQGYLQINSKLINYLINKLHFYNTCGQKSETNSIAKNIVVQFITQLSSSIDTIYQSYQDFRLQCQVLLNNERFFSQQITHQKNIQLDHIIDIYKSLKFGWKEKKQFQNAQELIQDYILTKNHGLYQTINSLNQQIKEIIELGDEQVIWQQNINELVDIIIDQLLQNTNSHSQQEIKIDNQQLILRIDINEIQNFNYIQQFLDKCAQIDEIIQKEITGWYIQSNCMELFKKFNRDQSIIDLNNIQRPQNYNLQNLNLEIKDLNKLYYFQCIHLNQEGEDRLSLLCLQTQNILNNEISKMDQALEMQVYEKVSKLQQQVNNDKWRIQHVILTQLLQINKSCWNVDLQVQIDYTILKFRVFETDKRVTAILDDQQYINQLNRMYNRVWVTQQDKIQQQIKDEIMKLNSLQVQIQTQSDIQARQLLLTEYSQLQNSIQVQLCNLENLSQVIGIQVIFLQDLKLDLLRMDSKLNKIMDNINEVIIDMQYLKGKTIHQMLQIRQNKILYQQRISEITGIYIPLFVQEFNFTKQIEEDRKLLYTEKIFSDAEVNTFIWGTNQIKDTMLIHGLAGCGKSTSGKKVEEFIWNFIQTQQQLNIQVTPIIPITVSLPSLVDPTNQIIEQTLKSDAYNFDNKQIFELKQVVEEGKLKLIIILDSFDELKPNFQINLIKSNNLFQWRSQNDIGFPKIIITSRTEVLQIKDHHKLFLSEKDNIQFYKEIRLIEFDNDQINKYINEYCIFKVKIIILEYCQPTDKKENQQEIMNKFQQLWSKIQLQPNSNDQFLIDQSLANRILQIFKENKNIQDLTLERSRGLLIELQEVWGPKHYLKYIESMQLNKILVTVFMMEIVIQVLPQMINQQNNLVKLKENFQMNYQKLRKSENDNDEQSNRIWEQLTQNHNFMRKINISLSQQEVYQLLELQEQFNDQEKKLITISLLGQNLTQYDFYETFFDIYIRKQLTKVIDDTFNYDQEVLYNEIYQFATNLANTMTLKNLTIIEYIPQGYLFQRKQIWQDQFFDDQDEKQGLFKRVYRKCIPLKKKFNSYQFNHKSLQEFLVSQHIVKFITLISKNNSDQQLEEIKTNMINQLDLKQDFMKGSVNFLVQRLQQISNIGQMLTHVNTYLIIVTSNFYILSFMLKQCQSYQDVYRLKNYENIKIINIVFFMISLIISEQKLWPRQ